MLATREKATCGYGMQKRGVVAPSLLCPRNVVPSHEAGEHSHHHLGLAVGNVFRKSVDAGSQLACHRDGVLGIGQPILIRGSSEHLAIIDASRIDGIHQVHDGIGIRDAGVLEVADLRSLLSRLELWKKKSPAWYC